MGNTTFRKGSLEMIPPEIVREIFGYLRWKTIRTINKMYYLQSINGLDTFSYNCILLRMFSLRELCHKYDHEELFDAICRSTDPMDILSHLSYSRQYVSSDIILLLRRYIVRTIDYCIRNKRRIYGRIVHLPIFNYASDLLENHISVDLNYLAGHAINTGNKELFKKCLADPHYSDHTKLRSVIKMVYRYRPKEALQYQQILESRWPEITIEYFASTALVLEDL